VFASQHLRIPVKLRVPPCGGSLNRLRICNRCFGSPAVAALIASETTGGRSVTQHMGHHYGPRRWNRGKLRNEVAQ
jgi:hypothetical protein